MTSSDAVYSRITDALIGRIEKAIQDIKDGKPSQAPWHKPWKSSGILSLPLSLSSRKPYRGINVWLLAFAAQDAGYNSPWWGTMKKINELGGTVDAGQHATSVVLWTRFTVTKTDSTGQEVEKTIPVLREFRVFNADQTTGLPVRFLGLDEDPEDDVESFDPIETAEAIVAGYAGGPEIRYALGRAFYRPATDVISVPNPEDFNIPAEYYSTLFHEMAHSTGHASRLNREGIADSGHYFGDPVYSREELVAEMTAAMLCGIAGIENLTLDNSISYLTSWAKKLRDEPKLLVQAASAAQKAADHIRGISYAEEAPKASEATTEAAQPVLVGV